ncbi:lipid droplet assembly factor 1 [Musca autumnalis]|uniref:lipid droplet assembly factor 1 n=1 Tax=Musca autumnalis TaxID=221902 RepID=UPI003CED27BD
MNEPGTQSQPNSSSAGNGNMESQEMLRLLLDVCRKLVLQLKILFNFVMVDLGGYQLIDRCVQWSVQNPQTALCILAGGLVAALPILIFIGIGLSTLFVTLTGFLVLEGTLLTIFSMMLCGLFGALLIVVLFFSIVGLFAYFGFAQIYDLYGSVESHKSALLRFMQNERQTSPTPQRVNGSQSATNQQTSGHEEIVN